MSEPVYFAQIKQSEFEHFRDISLEKRLHHHECGAWQEARNKVADLVLTAGLAVQLVPIRFADFEAFLAEYQITNPHFSFVDEFAKSKAKKPID